MEKGKEIVFFEHWFPLCSAVADDESGGLGIPLHCWSRTPTGEECIHSVGNPAQQDPLSESET